MNSEDFAVPCRLNCRNVGGYWAFYPPDLPPKLPLDWNLANQLTEAGRALAELSGAGQLLPNPHLLIRPYLRREAILSSRIENTIADVEELALFEAQSENEPVRSEVREVANYVRALEEGLRRIQEFPISSRLVCEMHRTLLGGVRGGEATKTPGEFRRSQNWIGRPNALLSDATFVPPPVEECSARWVLGKSTYTRIAWNLCSSNALCCTTSLNRSTLFWMEMAALADC